MKHIIVALKGILFGIANLIPGVSGGTMAVITGVYEALLDSINSLFKFFTKSLRFLVPFGIGIGIAVFLGSKLINLCMEYIPIPTTSLFIGLVAGGLPALAGPIRHKMNVKNILIALLAFSVVLVLLFIPTTERSRSTLEIYDYFILCICGFIASIAMVLPGISGMMMFMLFGYYDTLMSALAGLSDLSMLLDNLLVLLPVFIGVILGLFTACRIFSILLKKYPTQCYFAIIGFVIASILCVIYKMTVYEFTTIQVIFGFIMIPIGFFITYFLSKLNIEENPKKGEEKSSQ